MCVSDTVLWVIMALSKFTASVFNAELFSTLEVDGEKGLCVAMSVYFHFYYFLPYIANLLDFLHLQTDIKVKRGQDTVRGGGSLVFRQVLKGGITRLSRRLGSFVPFGEEF